MLKYSKLDTKTILFRYIVLKSGFTQGKNLLPGMEEQQIFQIHIWNTYSSLGCILGVFCRWTTLILVAIFYVKGNRMCMTFPRAVHSASEGWKPPPGSGVSKPLRATDQY